MDSSSELASRKQEITVVFQDGPENTFSQTTVFSREGKLEKSVIVNRKNKSLVQTTTFHPDGTHEQRCTTHRGTDSCEHTLHRRPDGSTAEKTVTKNAANVETTIIKQRSKSGDLVITVNEVSGSNRKSWGQRITKDKDGREHVESFMPSSES